VRNELLCQAIYGGFGFKIRHKRKSFANEMQALFSHFAQNKDEDKLESTGFVQFMRQSPGILHPKYFTETDVDILFTRLKEPNTKHMVYTAFVTVRLRGCSSPEPWYPSVGGPTLTAPTLTQARLKMQELLRHRGQV
jgi:hypothetical protein